MQRWIRGTAMAALAAVTMTSGVAAQGTPAPTVSVGGVGYAQYNYNLSGTQHNNAFDMTRTYINVTAKFAGGVSTRATSDIYRDPADGSLKYRLKYGYVAFQPNAGNVTYKFGLIQTPWVSREEDIWDYRMQGSIGVDRNGIMTSADFGLGADAKLAGGRLDLNLAIVNGEGYSKPEGDQRKDYEVRASYRIANSDDTGPYGGLRLSGYAGIGKPTTGGERNRFLGMISYRTKQYTLAAEYVTTKDSTTGPAAVAERKGSLISAFGVYHLTNSKVAVIGRVDIYDPNTDTANNKNTRIIAGASYQLSPNLRLLADADLLSHEAGDPTATIDPRNQFLLQAQFSF
ncbi:MAG TPA: hypothetical protein VFI13_00890 [Gemmatimonadales bacterium]|nr:hypothetical protein [Gemmatimonadales bacterium]